MAKLKTTKSGNVWSKVKLKKTKFGFMAYHPAKPRGWRGMEVIRYNKSRTKALIKKI